MLIKTAKQFAYDIDWQHTKHDPQYKAETADDSHRSPESLTGS